MFRFTFGGTVRDLVKDTSIYGVGALVTQLIPVLLLPILTRYLSPAEYGTVAIFTVSVGILSVFTGFNLQTAIQRNYVDHSKNELISFIGSAFIISFAATLFWLFIFYNFHSYLSQYFTLPGMWLYVVSITSFFQFSISVTMMIWRMERKPAQFVFFQVFTSTVNITLSLLFVTWLLWLWQGRALGMALSITVSGLFGIYFLYRSDYLAFRFDQERANAMLAFSIPLIPHVLCSLIINSSDRFFLVYMEGPAAVGLYSVGYALGQVIQLLQHAFSQAWVPLLFEMLKKDKAQDKIKIVKLIYIHHFIVLLMVITLHVSASFLLDILVGQKFQNAAVYVPWVAGGYAFHAMYRMVVPLLNYAKQTYLVSIGTLLAASLNLALNYILIKLSGPIGAAQATLFSFMLLYFVTFYYALRAYKMPWMFWRDGEAIEG